MNSLNDDNNYKITLFDLKEILKRKRRSIILAATLLGLGGLLFALDRPLLYVAEATFRDKGRADSGLHQSMADMFLGSGHSKNESEAVTTLRSKTIMEELIKNLNLQASISETGHSFPWIKNAQELAVAEWAGWKKQKTPELPDPARPLMLSNINYEGEVDRHFEILFMDDSRFEIKGRASEGALGQPFSVEGATLTLNKNTSEPLKGRTFNITVSSLKSLAKNLSGSFLAVTDLDDPSLIKIQYSHRDRHIAKDFVNHAMKTYQNYLGQEHGRIAVLQLNYLKKREGEIEVSLRDAMENHAKHISKDLSKSGFTDSKKEMEFLSHQLLQTTNKMMEINLERKRIEKLLEGDLDHYNTLSLEAPAIHEMLGKVRRLKAHQDNLELALADNGHTLRHENFLNEVEEQERLEKCCSEIDALQASLKKDAPLELYYLQDPKFLVSSWNGKLNQKREGRKGVQEFKEQFSDYLSNLSRLLAMQKATIQERLGHRQNQSHAFKGISLETADHIYINLAKDRQETETEIKQIDFVLTQMEKPDFEITSLGTVLNDPISQDRMGKALQLSLSLKDNGNRSQKELDRIRDELFIQKEFLQTHLRESAKLLQLKEGLLTDKTAELQEAMLEITHRDLSILEKQFRDYLSDRIANLDIEKDLIQDHHNEITAKMSKVPEQWIEEQILEQRLAQNQRMIEQITSMVESKNISSNLELVQSAPLDYASAPLHPRAPRLFLLTMAGTILGALLSSCYFVSKGLLKEVPLTYDNLTLNGFDTFGELQFKKKKAPLPAYDSNLNTLRRSLAKLLPHSKSCLILASQGPSFLPIVSDLIQRSGKKTVTIDFTSHEPGLREYLEGQIDLGELLKNDKITFGAPDRFQTEFLMLPRFKELLTYLGNMYDLTLAYSNAPLTSPEAEILLSHFGAALITLKNETFSEMKPVLKLVKDTFTGFIFYKKI